LRRPYDFTAKTRTGPPDAPSCFGAPTMSVAPVARHGAEIRHQLHGVLAGAEQREMRDELLRGADVEAQGIDACTDDVTFCSEEASGRFTESRRVHRAFCILIQKTIGCTDARVPTGVHRHERPARQSSVLLLPRHDVVDVERGVGILRRFATIEITASGAMSVSGAIRSQVVALATKCTGASMCVPVCSSNVISLAKKPSFASANFGVILTGLKAGEYRKPRREGVREIDDVAEALRETNGLRLRLLRGDLSRNRERAYRRTRERGHESSP
jgi:hypothetical protein